MAGHSKFKNIQFRKDRQDAIRSKLFSKFSRDITLAAKQGLPDPAANSRLRLAIANAKAESMPKENIERAIKKALGGDADTYEEIRYEGFGPGGAGLIVEVLTDNRNRAAANIRTLFGKHGGNLGETGSVAFMFDRLGRIIYPPAAMSDEAILEASIEAGAVDVESDGRAHTVFTAFEELAQVAEALERSIGPAHTTAVVWKAKSLVPAVGDSSVGLMKLIESLEVDDDVLNVWTNAELGDEESADGEP
ncbi:MAG TPA: YebC/PmpR family DNA-binding transcriptional regulator [Caulobacteraceae bacterium]